MSLPRFLSASMLLVALLITSCSALPGGNDPFEETHWSVVTLASEPAIPESSLILHFSEGRVRGSAGCNSFQGDYSVSGNRITFSDLAMTLMACPDAPAIMEQEQRFFSMLQKVNQFDLSGSHLSLATPDGTELIFERE